MQVQTLIEALQEFDPTTNVFVMGDDLENILAVHRGELGYIEIRFDQKNLCMDCPEYYDAESV